MNPGRVALTQAEYDELGKKILAALEDCRICAVSQHGPSAEPVCLARQTGFSRAWAGSEVTRT